MIKDTPEGTTHFCLACEEEARGVITTENIHTCGIKKVSTQPKNLSAEDIPMGYSAWIRYGKKYHYYDYARDIIEAKASARWCYKILQHSAKIPKSVLAELIKEI